MPSIYPTGTGGRGTRKRTGSRLSKATKAAVKSSGLRGAKRQALRQALRKPGVTATERRYLGSSAARAQSVRSTKRRIANRVGRGGYKTR